MEFVLEGLHQHSMVSKREEGLKTAYRDMLKAMFDHMSSERGKLGRRRACAGNTPSGTRRSRTS